MTFSIKKIVILPTHPLHYNNNNSFFSFFFRFYFIRKHPLFCARKHSVQRPDILTHFPSDGNIITGDILAHEIEAAAAEAEVEVEENRNSGDGDSISHYETIAVPHYSDFPKRPCPHVPELPPLPGLVTYIEIVPT